MNRTEHPQSRIRCRLNVVDVGTGEVVVLLHGLGSSHRDWAEQIEFLAQSHRVVALDLRGHGKSPAAAPGVTLGDLVEDVAGALVAHHAVGAHVVGWSLGGLVATLLAAKHPSLVRSLVVVNSPPSCRPSSFRERFLWTQRRVLTRCLSPRALGPFISKRLFPHPDQDGLRREFVDRFSMNDESSYRAVFGAIERYDCTGVPERVRCPVLVVTGDRDYWPVSAKRAHAARFEHGRLSVIAESGHATPIERPERFNAVLASFIAGPSARTSAPARTASNFAALCLVLSLFGCGGGAQADGEPSSELGVAPAAAPTAPTVGTSGDPGSTTAPGSTPNGTGSSPSGSTPPGSNGSGATLPGSAAPGSTVPGSPPPGSGAPSSDAGAGTTVPSAPSADSGAPAPGVPAPDSGSRCKVTTSSVYCDHNVTSFAASATEVRDVYWQTPLSAPPANGYPIVIVYQGSLFAPSLTWAELTPSVPFGGYYQGVLQASLLDHGFTVIAPTAAGGLAWQTNAGAPYETTTDYVFIGALLDAIKSGKFGPADPTHFYATGISSGGYMTSRMAVSYPGVFRALAIESGSYATCLGPICSVPATLPADHPPTLFLQGGADTTVPLATVQPYYNELVAQGVDTALVVDQSAGHQWLSVAPERVTDWFLKH